MEINELRPNLGVNNYLNVKNDLVAGLAENKNVFQSVLDRAVESLNSISSQELQADRMIADYVQGKAPLEEVMISIEKANLSINLALTVINSCVQTFKEIIQMQV